MSPKFAALIAAAVVFAFFSLGLNITQHGWANWYRMVQTGKVTTAKVTEIHPESHNSCTFEYIVAGKTYEGSDTGCDAVPGQTIQVRYLPSDPTFVTTRSPSGELGFQVFAVVFMSALAAIIVGFRASKKRVATNTD